MIQGFLAKFVMHVKRPSRSQLWERLGLLQIQNLKFGFYPFAEIFSCQLQQALRRNCDEVCSKLDELGHTGCVSRGVTASANVDAASPDFRNHLDTI